MSMTIDLNSDIGELDGAAGRKLDAGILSAVTSCNIACGGHAGDETSMRETIRIASQLDRRMGAHPSYPDRKNFGRRAFDISDAALADSLHEQVGTLIRIANEEAAEITHLKAHGALYNKAAGSAPLAKIICNCARAFDIPRVFGLPNSEIERAAKAAKLDFLAEGFVDRSYEVDGSLTPRGVEGAVHESAGTVKKQAIDLARDKQVRTRSGVVIKLPVKTLCLHGDTAGAIEMSREIRKALTDCGIEVRAYV